MFPLQWKLINLLFISYVSHGYLVEGIQPGSRLLRMPPSQQQNSNNVCLDQHTSISHTTVVQYITVQYSTVQYRRNLFFHQAYNLHITSFENKPGSCLILMQWMLFASSPYLISVESTSNFTKDIKLPSRVQYRIWPRLQYSIDLTFFSPGTFYPHRLRGNLGWPHYTNLNLKLDDSVAVQYYLVLLRALQT